MDYSPERFRTLSEALADLQAKLDETPNSKPRTRQDLQRMIDGLVAEIAERANRST